MNCELNSIFISLVLFFPVVWCLLNCFFICFSSVSFFHFKCFIRIEFYFRFPFVIFLCYKFRLWGHWTFGSYGGGIPRESSFSHRQIRNVTSKEIHLLELVTIRLLIYEERSTEPIKPNFLLLCTYFHTPVSIIIVVYFVLAHNVLLQDRFCVLFNLFPDKPLSLASPPCS